MWRARLSLSVTTLAAACLGLLLVGCTGDPPPTGPSAEVPTEVAVGVLRVSVFTTGKDVDRDGYTVRVGARTREIGASGVATFLDVAAGSHMVELSGLARNCVASSGTSLEIRVTDGSTARVAYEVTCSRLWDLAFSRFDGHDVHLALATADGSVIEIVGPGYTPNWSPKGAKLAYRCVNDPMPLGDICIASFDGRPPVHLIQSEDLFDPAWRPDGRLTLVRTFYDWDLDDRHFDALVVMNPDGSNRLELTLPPSVVQVSELAWSPDGQQLAFTCLPPDSGGSDICVMNADGSGLRQLTSDSASDGNPAWRPDGSAIAFHTNRYSGEEYEIVVTGLDGSPISRLSPGTEPSWSPDGSKIAFKGSDGLFVMNADGSGRTRLAHSTRDDFGPVWRP